jgi:hypothetical protein
MKKFPFLFLVLLCISCRDDTERLTNKSVIGSWNWVSTTGGLMVRERTPQTENSTMKLSITHSQMRWYKNDTLTSQVNYARQRKSLYTEERFRCSSLP